MKPTEIVSGNNRMFKVFQQLFRGQGIRKFGLALLSGPKQVREILEEFPDRCDGLVLRKDQDVFDRIVPETVRRYHLSPPLFRALDVHGTDQPIVLVRAGPLPLWNPDQWPRGCTLFVPFQDPVNVGAAIRSAAAFGVSQVVLLRESAHPFHHKASRVAGSALFRVPLFEGPSIRRLRRVKFPLIALSADGEDVSRFTFPPTFGLIPGIEGPGIPEGLKHLVALAVPMAPGVESLNAALATGIVLYSWRSRLPEPPEAVPLDKAPSGEYQTRGKEHRIRKAGTGTREFKRRVASS